MPYYIGDPKRDHNFDNAHMFLEGRIPRNPQVLARDVLFEGEATKLGLAARKAQGRNRDAFRGLAD